MSAKTRVLKALASGPLRTGDLITACGYDIGIMVLDSAIGITTRANWNGSSHQRALASLVGNGNVTYQRDRQQTVWYLLPGQEIPPVEGPSIPLFAEMVKAIWAELPESIRARDMEEGGAEPNPDADDAWYSFCEKGWYGVTLSLEEGGFQLADGDPICNWCMNSFTEHYPADVSPKVIADRIVEELHKQEPELARHGH